MGRLAKNKCSGLQNTIAEMLFASTSKLRRFDPLISNSALETRQSFLNFQMLCVGAIS